MKNLKTVVTATAFCTVLLCGSVWAQSPAPIFKVVVLSSCAAHGTASRPPQHIRLDIHSASVPDLKGWSLIGAVGSGRNYNLFANIYPTKPFECGAFIPVHVFGTSGNQIINASCCARVSLR